MKNKMIVKGNIQTAGIYFLKDAKGEVKYVGSGISIADRLSSHLYYLKRNL
jgi:excinuclease UvrABC nuclease subunit